MKKLSNVLGLAAAMLFAFGLATTANAKSHTWTGWISDSACGVKGANAGAKECTAKCIKEKGATYVFVNTKTQKVYPISNQNAVTDANIGSEVSLTGEMGKDGSIKVDSIKASGM